MAHFPSYHSECVSFLQKLIQVPSVNGEHTEDKIVELIANKAKELGLPYQIFQSKVGRPNIYVGDPESFKRNDSLLLVAHTDTVPIGDPSKWQCSPFSGEIKEGRLYGRGAVDCKGGIAVSLYVLKRLKDLGELHRAKFIGVADEESGASSTFGLKYVLEQGLNASGAIYTYGGGNDLYNSVNIGHRGVIRLLVKFKGESAHSGSLEWQTGKQGDNAIQSVVKFIQTMENLHFPGENRYFSDYRFVATPTLLNGGAGESIVPDQASVLYDMRTLPGQLKEEILKRIEEIAQKIPAKHGFTMEVKVHVPAALSDPETPFIHKILQVHKEVFGNQPVLKGSGPANESYMLIQRGIPTIAGYGPSGGGFHAANEFAHVESISKSLQFLEQLVLSNFNC